MQPVSAAEIQPNPVEITLGGRVRRVDYPIPAVLELDKRFQGLGNANQALLAAITDPSNVTGQGVAMAMNSAALDTVIWWLWAGLLHEDPKLTVQQLMAQLPPLADARWYWSTMQAMLAAYTARNVPKVEEQADPPEPAAVTGIPPAGESTGDPSS